MFSSVLPAGRLHFTIQGKAKMFSSVLPAGRLHFTIQGKAKMFSSVLPAEGPTFYHPGEG